MTVIQVIFVIVSAITLLAALMVVSRNNIFHSALALVLTFIGVAGLYVLLDAGFLAVVQILIYVGAITVLIIFAIMLTRRIADPAIQRSNEQRVIGGVAAVILLAVMILGLLGTTWAASGQEMAGDPIESLGRALMDTYLLPFEVASILLLVALVGAIVIARDPGREMADEKEALAARGEGDASVGEVAS
jgi:NADH-quinone oxidoreductase subunit J